MDPNANILALLSVCHEIQSIQDLCPEDGNFKPEQEEQLARHACRAAEYVLALDEWLCKQGFLPARWDRRVELTDVQQANLADLLWDTLPRDPEHEDRRSLVIGTKTKLGLARVIERIVNDHTPGWVTK